MSDPLLPHSRRPADVLLPFLILRSPRTELRLISNDPHLRWLSPPISNPSHATVKKNPTRCRHCRTPPFHPAPHRKPETRKDTLAPRPRPATHAMLSHTNPNCRAIDGEVKAQFPDLVLAKPLMCQFSTQKGSGG
jgi:hypothetical protein